MLVTLKEILRMAEARQCAIGSFNTPNLESIQAVIGAAEELDVPVILMHAQCHEDLTPLEIIGPVMVRMAERAAVPVCVHLDQGKTLSYLWKALKIGFTSVMYDGSALPYEENVANTCIAVSMGRRKGASVEAEIGIHGRPDSVSLPERYTNPDDAKRFVEETGVDALACAFGNAQGIPQKDRVLDLDLLDSVRKSVRVPLVMNGGSGLTGEDYRSVITHGIRKINYYTCMALSGGSEVARRINSSVSDDQILYFHEIASWGRDAMKEHVRSVLCAFNA